MIKRVLETPQAEMRVLMGCMAGGMLGTVLLMLLLFKGFDLSLLLLGLVVGYFLGAALYTWRFVPISIVGGGVRSLLFLSFIPLLYHIFAKTLLSAAAGWVFVIYMFVKLRKAIAAQG